MFARGPDGSPRNRATSRACTSSAWSALLESSANGSSVMCSSSPRRLRRQVPATAPSARIAGWMKPPPAWMRFANAAARARGRGSRSRGGRGRSAPSSATCPRPAAVAAADGSSSMSENRATRAAQADARPGREVLRLRGPVCGAVARREPRERRVGFQGDRRRAEPVVEQGVARLARRPDAAHDAAQRRVADEMRRRLTAAIDRHAAGDQPVDELSARERTALGQQLRQRRERALALLVVQSERQPPPPARRREDRAEQPEQPAGVLGCQVVQRAAQRPGPDDGAVAVAGALDGGEVEAAAAGPQGEGCGDGILGLDPARVARRAPRRPWRAGRSVAAPAARSARRSASRRACVTPARRASVRARRRSRARRPRRRGRRARRRRTWPARRSTPTPPTTPTTPQIVSATPASRQAATSARRPSSSPRR